MPTFAHHRLHAYHASLDLARAAHDVATRIPRGHRSVADQLFRAGTAVPLLIAEGAHRVFARQKRQRFIEARGECGEVVAITELLERLDMVQAEDVRSVVEAADRVVGLLTGLIRKFS